MAQVYRLIQLLCCVVTHCKQRIQQLLFLVCCVVTLCKRIQLLFLVLVVFSYSISNMIKRGEIRFRFYTAKKKNQSFSYHRERFYKISQNGYKAAVIKFKIEC